MVLLDQRLAATEVSSSTKRNRRPKKRQLFCPAHPEQLIEGNGRKYYLHLLQPGQLQERGIPAKRAQLIINAYPVLVLSRFGEIRVGVPVRLFSTTPLSLGTGPRKLSSSGGRLGSTQASEPRAL